MLQTIGRMFGLGKGRLDVESRFEINKVPARGSWSVVHRAKEISTDQTFALKLINPKKVQAFRDRFDKLKFDSEGEIQQQFDSPHVVKAFESGLTTEGQPYILMEYVKAPLLEDFYNGYRSDKIPKPLALIKQLSQTIYRIHEAGFIHRDICPRNIFVTDDLMSCKLFDFGLSVPALPEFNQPGNRTGSPMHMAPEIARRRPTDNRVDIFAFGVVAYRLLTGHHPWGTTEDNSKASLLHNTQQPTPILEHLPNLNKNLAAAIDRCLNQNPEKRFPDLKRFLIQAGGIKRDVA